VGLGSDWVARIIPRHFLVGTNNPVVAPLRSIRPSRLSEPLPQIGEDLYMARGRNNRYSEEVKADAVALVHKSGRPIAAVAEVLGVDDSALSIGCGNRAPNWARMKSPNLTNSVVFANG
jgi:hypothetical protein